MNQFVDPKSIVRQIWGKSETVIFIFAGASAEFALNKAVDWLFFTGKLPADPLGRLFSTVAYAQKIVFADALTAIETIRKIHHIHLQVEQNRGSKIPDWAYRDVLYMLIDYSIRAYEVLERPLTLSEKKEVYEVFYRMGMHMDLQSLPSSFEEWTGDRIHHMINDLQYSTYSKMLFQEYEKHLGVLRYSLLLEAQKMMVPEQVRKMFQWNGIFLLKPAVLVYKMLGEGIITDSIKKLVLPDAYKEQVAGLDVKP